MRVWVTKYALTKGVACVEAEVSMLTPSMITYRQDFLGCKSAYRESAHGSDWHKTEEAAIKKAELMRKAKIRELKEKLQKLEAMEFKLQNEGVEST